VAGGFVEQSRRAPKRELIENDEETKGESELSRVHLLFFRGLRENNDGFIFSQK